MAVLIGSARMDENGGYSGGKAGSQIAKEISTQNWYLHSKGWVLIRPKDSNAAEKIAKNMVRATDIEQAITIQRTALLYSCHSSPSFSKAILNLLL